MRAAVAAAVLVLCPAAPAKTYTPTGEYQNFGDAPHNARVRYPVTLDHNKIPIVQYDGFYAHNPVAIAQYGLARFSLWKRYGDRHRWVQAKRAADWLVRSQDRSGSWTYGFDWDTRDAGTLEAPWKSALAQGQGISLLRRIGHVTKDRRYRDAAVRAIEPLAVRVAKGGVARHSWGGLWFEEYPTPSPYRALSGHMQTLLGLYDGSALASRARVLYRRGRRALLNGLRYYNLSGWSLYATATSEGTVWLASPAYHESHLVMLRILDGLHPHRTLRHWASVWGETTSPPPPASSRRLTAPSP